MHPMSPALAEMVARRTAQEWLSASPSVDPAELVRSIYRALGEVHRTRPRIVAFAPEVALKRALDLLHGGPRPRRKPHQPRPSVSGALTLVTRS